MHQDDLALAGEFVSRLASKIDPGIFDVTLFGSRARGKGNIKQDDPRAWFDLSMRSTGWTMSLSKG